MFSLQGKCLDTCDGLLIQETEFPSSLDLTRLLPNPPSPCGLALVFYYNNNNPNPPSTKNPTGLALIPKCNNCPYHYPRLYNS